MDEEHADAAGYISSRYQPPALLPIARHRESLLYVIETYPVTILIGQTGSGKTTQIPQYLYKAGWCSRGKAVAVTQPRRVAATSVAARVAEEMNCQLGQEVGYSIRFEDLTSPETRIKFLTDGMLLREALVDPLLSRYSVIMVDEAHERSLSSDILIGLLKKIMKKRPELRVIISSATIQAEEFHDYFSAQEATKETSNGRPLNDPKCRIVSIEGRTHPVAISYLEKPTEDYVARAVETVFDIHRQENDGDVLVFLTGREEIEKAMNLINERAMDENINNPAISVMPLYAGLSSEQQMMVFEEAAENTRKVIVATNIAEASVTIEGINFVIDCGFVKLRSYNPKTGIESLTAVPVSKASANQRAGRAGRTRPGKCFRLYPELAFTKLNEHTIPEIQRSNLAPLMLQLKALGIDNIARFDYLAPPPAELVLRALEILYSLGALDDYAKLTRPLGLRMAELSLDPMMSKVLLAAPDFGCLSEILTIAAMTTLQGSIWIYHDGEKKATEAARRKFAVDEGDHITLLNVYQTFITTGKKEAKWCRDNLLNYKAMTKAVSARNQLRKYLERFGIKTEESLAGAHRVGGPDKAEMIRRCLTTGYFAFAAKMQPDGSFKTVNGTTLYAHPTSVMFSRKAEWVIFHEIMETRKKTYIRDISKIEREWLLEYAPEFYKSGS